MRAEAEAQKSQRLSQVTAQADAALKQAQALEPNVRVRVQLIGHL